MNAIKTKRPMSLATFLKDAASRGNGIKYRAEKNKTHRMYIIPLTVTDEAGNTETGIFAEAHNIHEWNSGGKFNSAECTKETLGYCPFCDRVNDAWSIYKMRIDSVTERLKAQGLDDAAIQYKIKGEQDPEKRRKPNAYKGLSSTFIDELKMKDIKPYLYVLVAQYELGADLNPICEDGLPKFTLKVMRLPEKRAQKLSEIFATAGGHIEDNEITIQYGDYDDAASLVGQSSIAAVFPSYQFVTTYPGLREKIAKEAAEFDITSLDKSFEELTQYEPGAAKALADAGFATWDRYVAERSINPNAKYLEYSDVAGDTPSLNGAAASAPTFNLPNMAAPVPPVGTPVQPAAPAPQAAAPVPPVGTPVVPPVGAPAQTAAPVPPVGAPSQAAPAGAGAAPQTGAAPFNFTI